MTAATRPASVRSDAFELTVVEVVQETADAVSIEFEVPAELVERCRYRPGQFLTLRVPVGESSLARCYSLSSSPHLDDVLAVTVKRVSDGRASNWLCDNVRPGDRLTALAPSGRFHPTSLDVDLLLVAAGSGITPVMSILTSALIGGTASVHLLYANSGVDAVIFGADLTDMAEEYPDRLTVEHWLESERGRPTVDAFSQQFGGLGARDAYVCGPGPFMELAEAALSQVGFRPERVHVERFRSLGGDPFLDHRGPDQNGPSDSGDDVEPVELEVVVGGMRRTLAWKRHRTMLDTVLDAGLDVPYSCREGACSSCVCTVRGGEVRMLVDDTLTDADRLAGVTLACQAIPVSDSVHAVFE
ncbi:MAG: ferredoxin--NADP reductase [Rhodococcus sp. (in: high G+C Gram-positive bacteria)]